jgi:hypothetical protein
MIDMAENKDMDESKVDTEETSTMKENKDIEGNKHLGETKAIQVEVMAIPQVHPNSLQVSIK